MELFPKTVYGFKLFIVFKKKLYLRRLTDASVSLRAADVPSYSAINLCSNIYNDYSKMRKPLQMTMSLNIHQYSHISSFIHPSLDIIYRFFLDSSECRLIQPYATCEIRRGSCGFNQSEMFFFFFFILACLLLSFHKFIADQYKLHFYKYILATLDNITKRILKY